MKQFSISVILLFSILFGSNINAQENIYQFKVTGSVWKYI